MHESFGRFFLPGPTEVRPEVLAAMSRPVVGHRGPEVELILASAQPVLRLLFGTERTVCVATCSATGLMEAAVRAGVRRRALCLVNGAFSGRFREIVESCGREADAYEVAWGEAHDPDQVRRRLVEGEHDAVTVVHSETSTGVLNPLPEIAAAVRDAERERGDEILLLADGVTSVGGMRMRMDRWGVDVLLTGSQKALALPPGLAFAAASERALRRAETLPDRGRYLDLLDLNRYAERNATPTTPAVSLLFALQVQARRLEAEGVGARAARHAEMAAACHAWAEARASGGVGVAAPAGFRSPTVTALETGGRAPRAIVAAMRERGWTIGGGYGRWKDTTVRIGHMGDHRPDELERLLSALDQVMNEVEREETA